jgi:hypothetical protein
LQFLATDLGIVRYPQYQQQRSGAAFASRQELLNYEAALDHAAQLAEAHEVRAAFCCSWAGEMQHRVDCARIGCWRPQQRSLLTGLGFTLAFTFFYEAVHPRCVPLNAPPQSGDWASFEDVLQHAWRALDAGLHKQRREGVHSFLQRFCSGTAGRRREADSRPALECVGCRAPFIAGGLLLLPCLLSDYCGTLCCGACTAAAGWVYCTMATMGVDFLEKQKRYKEAVQRLEMLLGEWQDRVGL